MIVFKIDYAQAKPEEITAFQRLPAVKAALEFLATEGAGLGIKLEINIPKAQKVKPFKTAKVIDPEYPNRGEKWTQPDNIRLTNLWKSGSILDDITQQFGRTAGALAAQVVKLGLEADIQTARMINVDRGGIYGSIPSTP